VSERSKQNTELVMEMKKIHKESRGTYGLPRLHAKLTQDGKSASRGKVSRLMKKEGISGLIKKRFRVHTTDSKHDLPLAERIFQTEEPATHPVAPNKTWASDITYVPTGEGFLFLGTYLDLFTRKVTGFAVEDHMRDRHLPRERFAARFVIDRDREAVRIVSGRGGFFGGAFGRRPGCIGGVGGVGVN